MSGPLESVDKQTHDEMCCTLAALILYDDGIEITGDKLNKLIAASGNKVESYWPQLFAKALQGRNIGDLLVGGGPAPAGGATTTATAPVETKKEEAKKKEDEKKDDDIGGPIGLFDDDGF